MMKKYGVSFRKLYSTGVAMLTALLHLQSSNVLEEKAKAIAIQIEERTKLVFGTILEAVYSNSDSNLHCSFFMV
jgi:hypothetical protein